MKTRGLEITLLCNCPRLPPRNRVLICTTKPNAMIAHVLGAVSQAMGQLWQKNDLYLASDPGLFVMECDQVHGHDVGGPMWETPDVYDS